MLKQSISQMNSDVSGFLMMVYAAHLAKVKDPDFWRRLENQILL
jgi:hypothetical protein